MKKYIVTGTDGFIGKKVAKAIEASGNDVISITYSTIYVYVYFHFLKISVVE